MKLVVCEGRNRCIAPIRLMNRCIHVYPHYVEHLNTRCDKWRCQTRLKSKCRPIEEVSADETRNL